MDVRDRVAAELAAGLSLRTIAKRLNVERIPAPRGGQWHPETVARQVDSYRARYNAYMAKARAAHRWNRGGW